MSVTITNRNFKNKGKDIKYLNKDFASFRNNLIEFAKTYFPKTYSDFNESSPGMMFIEMASYIGDSLSYYIDDTLKESLMAYAEDPQSVLALSQYLGYRPKVTAPAITTLSVYQLVPSIGIGINNKPDEKYYLRIKEGMLSKSTKAGIIFRTTDLVDFSDETNREITIYQRDANTGEPLFYLVKKYVQALSGELKEKQVTYTTYSPFQKINLDETNIIQIYDVRDSNGNKWYEVPYLAQEMVYLDSPNNETNDPDLYQFKSTVPFVLKTIKTPRRFVTKVNQDNTTSIQFGAGDSSASDEQLIPNLKNVGLGLPNSISRPVGELVRVNTIEFDEDNESLNASELAIYNTVKNSIAIDNEVPATGGRGAESLEEIRQNALANFGSQNRAVTAKDYQIRALSMPTKFGAVAKAFAVADGTLDNNSPASILASPNNLQEFTDLVMSFVSKPDDEEPTQQSIKEQITKFLIGKTSNENEKNNPFAINLYLLGYNGNGNLTNINRGVKENLKTYMNEYRLLTDGINLLDGFVINIGIEFEIIVFSNYNKSEILTKCISELKQYFSIDNWTFNQTINLSEVELLIANVEGVSSVPMVKIVNKCGGRYSSNSYNIDAATKDKIIYPSLDPSVFEIKYPDSDIKGRVR